MDLLCDEDAKFVAENELEPLQLTEQPNEQCNRNVATLMDSNNESNGFNSGINWIYYEQSFFWTTPPPSKVGFS